MKLLTTFAFCAIIGITSYSCVAQNNLEIQTFVWQKFPLADLNFTEESELVFSANAIVKTRGNLLYILALEAENFKITSNTSTINVTIEQNPLFDPEWEHLPIDSIPTPLTQEQNQVFRNFALYRLINKPIKDYMAENQTALLDSIDGKTTFLNFWYYGCMPCMAEIPALNQLYNDLKDDTDIKMYSLFRDSVKYENGKPLFQSTGYSTLNNKYNYVDIALPQVPNSKAVSKMLNVSAYPTNMIIDKYGIIRKIYTGAYVGDDKANMKTIGMIKRDIEKLKH